MEEEEGGRGEREVWIVEFESDSRRFFSSQFQVSSGAFGEGRP